MRVVVTGGGGFLGKKLVAALLARGTLIGGDGVVASLERITVFDLTPPEGLMSDPRLEIRTGDLADPAVVSDLIGAGTTGVFHLAAIVSANAEEDFDLGMAVNFDGTRHVLEACRALATPPKLVFASSCAVFGGDMPEVLTDQTFLNPQTSYGTQKAIGELLVQDYARKGFVDGRALRLPTIVVRPGKPNKAASTFASSILREPLAGEDALCPVSDDIAMYVLSPRKVIQALIHAFELPGAAFGPARMLTLPGISVTVGEMLRALREIGGDAALARVRREIDPRIMTIVTGWPKDADGKRALELGFERDTDIHEIVRAHVEDELGGRIR